MEPKEVTTKLAALIQLDIDALYAYEEAIARMEVSLVRERLREFQADHDRHIRVLSAYLRQNGAQPPEHTRALAGPALAGIAAVRSLLGAEGTLAAMVRTEQATNAAFRDALAGDLPADARSIVERYYADERRHLDYLREALATRAWEQAA